MFEQIEGPDAVSAEKKRTDYTRLKIVAAIAPVFMLFVYFDHLI